MNKATRNANIIWLGVILLLSWVVVCVKGQEPLRISYYEDPPRVSSKRRGAGLHGIFGVLLDQLFEGFDFELKLSTISVYVKLTH